MHPFPGSSGSFTPLRKFKLRRLLVYRLAGIVYVKAASRSMSSLNSLFAAQGTRALKVPCTIRPSSSLCDIELLFVAS